MEKPAQPNTSKPSDHLANERTFLAWIRTSIAVMAFGFVVVKFSLFIKQLSFVLAGKNVPAAKGFSGMIGITLVLIGTLLTLLGYLRYRNTEKQLENNTYKPSYMLSLLTVAAIVLISLLLIWYLLPNI